jgi:hypothetical protein
MSHFSAQHSILHERQDNNAQMKGEVKSAKKIEYLWMEGSEKAATPHHHF